MRFYIWEGRPYRSKRETITDYMQITTIFKCKIYPYGIMIDPPDGKAGVSYNPWYNLSELARLDGMVPPTGNTLRDVLISKNGQISKDGIEAQIIRWTREVNNDG
ncbi:MAG TPA: hypothetical protein PLW50_00020 [Smithellaceae bacterium]|nr:hypothetical protein [Smithellaceae bacterium]